MFKRLSAIAMSALLAVGVVTPVLAAESTITNKDLVVEKAYEEIKQQIIDDYCELYDLDNFDYDYELKENDGKEYAAIDVYVDMTLTRHPSDSPFVKGMEAELAKTRSVENDEKLQEVIDFYINEVETLYYNIPDRSTFTYAIELKNTDNNIIERKSNEEVSYNLFYRTDTDDEILLEDADRLAPVENEQEAFKSGQEVIQKISSENSSFMTRPTTRVSWTYDRLDARDWARDNAYSTPEFPSQTVSGTDCANFVSKALNAGGIPEDSSGDWYRASTWGGWPGDNWLRTGYYSNGGVVTYMEDEGYFYEQSDESKVCAGSIMFWNNTSHVALVTYGDTVTIKYTQHGATQSKDTVYRTEDASFYMPYASIQ